MKKTNFISYDWFVVKYADGWRNKLPETDGVYILTVKSQLFKKRKIVYIGVTENVSVRMKNHNVFSLLRYNCFGYEVEVLFRSFGIHANNHNESLLIKKHKPPFNGGYKKNREYSVWDLWKDLGVKDVKYRIRKNCKNLLSHV